MPKKGKHKNEPTPSEPAPDPPQAKGFLENLDDHEKEREIEAMKAREKKAQAAQREDMKRNWRREEAARKQKNEEVKWSRSVNKSLKKSVQDGILEAQENEDGKWYVKVSEDDDGWVECKGQYYCPHCNKHLTDASLQGHLESNDHTRRMGWLKGNWGGNGAAPAQGAQATAGGGASGSASNGASGGAWAAPFPANNRPHWSHESWAEPVGDGSWRCTLCNRCLDDWHVDSEPHKKRLEEFLWTKKPLAERYPDPPEEFIAWVPHNETYPDERGLRCLLCSKWVQDLTSHALRGGSQEHQKHLRNHYEVKSAWYRQEVVPLKKKWSVGGRAAPPYAAESACSPKAPAGDAAAQACEAPTSGSATPAPAQAARWARAPDSQESRLAGPSTEPPWQAVWDQGGGKYYYWNTETNEVTWEEPIKRHQPDCGVASPCVTNSVVEEC